MDVQCPAGGDVEHRLRQEQLRRPRRPCASALKARRRSSVFGRSQTFRLEDLQTRGQRQALDRARIARRPRPERPVRLSKHQRRCHVRLRSDAESARSANSGVPAKTRRRKGDQADFRSCLASLARMRCCFNCDRCSTNTLPLQMIHLVLDADREQSLSLKGESGRRSGRRPAPSPARRAPPARRCRAPKGSPPRYRIRRWLRQFPD